MTPQQFSDTIQTPQLARFAAIVPRVPITIPSRLIMLTIAGQEGGWEFRIQAGNGPAHGFYQFERRGGVAGVLGDTVTTGAARDLCAAVGIVASSVNAWAMMASPAGDLLAVGFARLLLWSDPAALPAPGDVEGAWNYYLRNWRPGSPRPAAWQSNYSAAYAVLSAEITASEP